MSEGFSEFFDVLLKVVDKNKLDVTQVINLDEIGNPLQTKPKKKLKIIA